MKYKTILDYNNLFLNTKKELSLSILGEIRHESPEINHGSVSFSLPCPAVFNRSFNVSFLFIKY